MEHLKKYWWAYLLGLIAIYFIYKKASTQKQPKGCPPGAVGCGPGMYICPDGSTPFVASGVTGLHQCADGSIAKYLAP